MYGEHWCRTGANVPRFHRDDRLRRRIARVGDDADEAVFSDRTGSPAAGTVVGTRFVRRFVTDVIRIEKRHEQVDVEQRRPAHVSSRRVLTSFMVDRTAPAGLRRRSGTPLRTRPDRDGVNAFRANSDTTLPAVVPRAAAISLAAWRMSSSRSSVVRISASSRIRCQSHGLARRLAWPSCPAAVSSRSTGQFRWFPRRR